MAATEKITQLQWDGEALQAMLPSVEASPWGGLESPREVLGGSWLFEFREGRQQVLVAARPVRCEHGMRLDVVGMRSLGERFHAATLDAAFMGVARAVGADLIAMNTKHEHIVRACERQGWTCSGHVVIKPVRLQ